MQSGDRKDHKEEEGRVTLEKVADSKDLSYIQDIIKMIFESDLEIYKEGQKIGFAGDIAPKEQIQLETINTNLLNALKEALKGRIVENSTFSLALMKPEEAFGFQPTELDVDPTDSNKKLPPVGAQYYAHKYKDKKGFTLALKNFALDYLDTQIKSINDKYNVDPASKKKFLEEWKKLKEELSKQINLQTQQAIKVKAKEEQESTIVSRARLEAKKEGVVMDEIMDEVIESHDRVSMANFICLKFPDEVKRVEEKTLPKTAGTADVKDQTKIYKPLPDPLFAMIKLRVPSDLVGVQRVYQQISRDYADLGHDVPRVDYITLLKQIKTFMTDKIFNYEIVQRNDGTFEARYHFPIFLSNGKGINLLSQPLAHDQHFLNNLRGHIEALTTLGGDIHRGFFEIAKDISKKITSDDVTPAIKTLLMDRTYYELFRKGLLKIEDFQNKRLEDVNAVYLPYKKLISDALNKQLLTREQVVTLDNKAFKLISLAPEILEKKDFDLNGLAVFTAGDMEYIEKQNPAMRISNFTVLYMLRLAQQQAAMGKSPTLFQYKESSKEHTFDIGMEHFALLELAREGVLSLDGIQKLAASNQLLETVQNLKNIQDKSPIIKFLYLQGVLKIDDIKNIPERMVLQDTQESSRLVAIAGTKFFQDIDRKELAPIIRQFMKLAQANLVDESDLYHLMMNQPLRTAMKLIDGKENREAGKSPQSTEPSKSKQPTESKGDKVLLHSKDPYNKEVRNFCLDAFNRKMNSLLAEGSKDPTETFQKFKDLGKAVGIDEIDELIHAKKMMVSLMHVLSQTLPDPKTKEEAPDVDVAWMGAATPQSAKQTSKSSAGKPKAGDEWGEENAGDEWAAAAEDEWGAEEDWGDEESAQSDKSAARSAKSSNQEMPPFDYHYVNVNKLSEFISNITESKQTLSLEDLRKAVSNIFRSDESKLDSVQQKDKLSSLEKLQQCYDSLTQKDFQTKLSKTVQAAKKKGAQAKDPFLTKLETFTTALSQWVPPKPEGQGMKLRA